MNIVERCQHLEDQNEAAFPIDNPSKIWRRSTTILDVTIVIPICIPTILAKNAYPQAKKILLLSNGDGPRHTDCASVEIRRVAWKGHAQTRKEALPHIDTRYTFFTVQDAYPVGDMLPSLLREMESNSWDILLPRQIPWPDADPITKARISRWMPPATKTYLFPQADHVGALYRTEDLRSWPLAEPAIAEDLWWSRGRRVGCAPQAEIFHSRRSKQDSTK